MTDDQEIRSMKLAAYVLWSVTLSAVAGAVVLVAARFISTI